MFSANRRIFLLPVSSGCPVYSQLAPRDTCQDLKGEQSPLLPLAQEGELKLDYYTKAKKWYFISLPFDLDIAKITHDVAGTQYAIRSYDGAARAINGATGNWKNIDRTTTIPAGTGFIFQTNVDTHPPSDGIDG